jgi:Saxitoxin biosynthesis operon protein SxtJ
MALLERKRATRTDLAWFGLIFAALFGLLGLLTLWRSSWHLRTTPIVLWCIGAIGSLLYYAIRPIQRPFYDGFLTIVYPIGWLVSHLMMILIYHVVLTPIGLIMRLLGRDPMNRAFDRAASSYWVPHDLNKSSRRYFQQF